MIGGDGKGFVFCSDNNAAPGQMVGLSKEPSRTLVDSGYRCFIEDVGATPQMSRWWRRYSCRPRETPSR